LSHLLNLREDLRYEEKRKEMGRKEEEEEET